MDVLTKIDNLYAGILLEHQLSSDGSLVNITLQQARKFKREAFQKDRTSQSEASTEVRREKLKTDDYWTSIKGEVFVILASEIVTLNLQYVPRPKPATVKASSALIRKIRAAKIAKMPTIRLIGDSEHSVEL